MQPALASANAAAATPGVTQKRRAHDARRPTARWQLPLIPKVPPKSRLSIYRQSSPPRLWRMPRIWLGSAHKKRAEDCPSLQPCQSFSDCLFCRGEALGDFTPVHHVPEGRDVVGPLVLVLEV